MKFMKWRLCADSEREASETRARDLATIASIRRTMMRLFAPTTTNAADPSHERWIVESLPPFPAVALRALNLMAGPENSLRDLCDLIRADSAFSSAVLRLANSPLIGFPKPITSIVQASMLLGFRRLRSVVITIGLKAYFEDCYTPVLRSCWRHCVASAIIAERAAGAALLDKDFAHAAAILHDIGRVAMAVSMPHSYTQVVETETDRPEDLLPREREICGIDHCQAGLALVEAWDLPAAFIEIISRHHDSRVAADDVASIARTSCRLADGLGFSVTGYRALSGYEQILGDFPGFSGRAFPANAKELAASIRDEIRVIESE